MALAVATRRLRRHQIIVELGQIVVIGRNGVRRRSPLIRHVSQKVVDGLGQLVGGDSISGEHASSRPW